MAYETWFPSMLLFSFEIELAVDILSFLSITELECWPDQVMEGFGDGQSHLSPQGEVINFQGRYYLDRLLPF